MLEIVGSYYCMQLQGKVIKQTQKMAKNLVTGSILVDLVQIRANLFFLFKNMAPSVTRYYGQLSSCTISAKTNYPILKKNLVTNGRTRMISQNAV